MNDKPVRKTITVKASVERAFEVFTHEMDSWWPRTHHIGQAPLKRTILEGWAGGRCYSEQVEAPECDWGRILVWEPPHRFVMAWQVNHQTWSYEPDLAKASEVEVRFIPEPGGATRVDLEHRFLYRHGPDVDSTYATFDAPGAWSGMLRLYASQVEVQEVAQ